MATKAEPKVSEEEAAVLLGAVHMNDAFKELVEERKALVESIHAFTVALLKEIKELKAARAGIEL